MNTVIVGAGGHSRVVYDILRFDQNINVVAFVDNSRRGSDETIMGVPVVGDHDVLPTIISEQNVDSFIIAVGDNEIRRKYFQTLSDMGLRPISAIHPNSQISELAEIGSGTVVAAGANVSTNAEVGTNAIINTGAIVDHESSVRDHAHIGPGSVIAGRVEVAEGVFVGMGCAIKEYTFIGEEATIGAGSVVLNDVDPNTTVAGAPAEKK